jgi:hypothetical protein
MKRRQPVLRERGAPTVRIRVSSVRAERTIRHSARHPVRSVRRVRSVTRAALSAVYALSDTSAPQRGAPRATHVLRAITAVYREEQCAAPAPAVTSAHRPAAAPAHPAPRACTATPAAPSAVRVTPAITAPLPAAQPARPARQVRSAARRGAPRAPRVPMDSLRRSSEATSVRPARREPLPTRHTRPVWRFPVLPRGPARTRACSVHRLRIPPRHRLHSTWRYARRKQRR